jgi:hypothetical protein
LKHGADPNVKDAREKKPIDFTKSEAVKVRLKNAIVMAPIISTSLGIVTIFTLFSQSYRFSYWINFSAMFKRDLVFLFINVD